MMAKSEDEHDAMIYAKAYQSGVAALKALQATNQSNHERLTSYSPATQSSPYAQDVALLHPLGSLWPHQNSTNMPTSMVRSINYKCSCLFKGLV